MRRQNLSWRLEAKSASNFQQGPTSPQTSKSNLDSLIARLFKAESRVYPCSTRPWPLESISCSGERWAGHPIGAGNIDDGDASRVVLLLALLLLLMLPCPR